MTLDASALLSILFGEAGALDLVDRILEADVVRVGTPTLVEAAVVLGARRGTSAAKEVARLVEELGVTVVPFGAAEWPIAVDAYDRFGRGRQPAALNFGDCLAYAMAASACDTLLSVGNDFSKTDIQSA